MATIRIDSDFIVDCLDEGHVSYKVTSFDWNSCTKQANVELDFKSVYSDPIEYEDDDYVTTEDYDNLKQEHEEKLAEVMADFAGLASDYAALQARAIELEKELNALKEQLKKPTWKIW